MQITKRKFLPTAPDIVTVVAQVAALPPADFEEVLHACGRLPTWIGSVLGLVAADIGGMRP